MENEKLSSVLRKFVKQVSECYGSHDRPLTINDLRLGIRNLRMSEITDWHNHELDVIEVHASQFDGSEPMESALTLPSEGETVVNPVTLSSICAPSPYAWT